MSSSVIGIGEALCDLLLEGRKLGGAPTNFAYHACALGAHARIITRVGDDQDGHEIRRRLGAMGLSTDLVQSDESAPTGTVSVVVSSGGVPDFTIHENVAWDRLVATPAAFAAVRQADALCFGSLAQRCESSRRSIRSLVAAASPESCRIFDINLRQRYFTREVVEESLRLASVLKLNDLELPVVGGMFGLSGTDYRRVESLAALFGLQAVALTRGPRGSLLYRTGRWSERPAARVEVRDTVGAGDSFTAVLCLGLLAGAELDEINAAANEVSAFVCGCDGAMPTLPERLRRRVAALGPSRQARISRPE